MEPDAVVIGSGPNGLVGALTLAQAGLQVLVLEAAASPGGGTRTESLTLPGFRHDVCSSIHPLAMASPAMRSLDWASRGVEWVHSPAPLAHPLDGGRVAVLERSLDATAARLGAQAAAYRRLVAPTVSAGFGVTDSLLDPLSVPRHPVALARFGLTGIRSAAGITGRWRNDGAAALLAGCAAHSMLSLRGPTTAGYGMLLAALGHTVGWPFARGGSGAIAAALVAMIEAAGGEVRCNTMVESLADLPPARVILADVGPHQLDAMVGDTFPARYRKVLQRFRYGPGVFKMDWALDGPVPWTNPEVARAATVHVGGSAGEVAVSEAEVAAGRHPERPFVLVAQHSAFDASRAPEGRATLWGYCHVPIGSTRDMTRTIEDQIERFAPGFRDRVLARHGENTTELQARNPNLVGGDIGGGAADLRQLVVRPSLSPTPWATPVKGLYLCSASTPPGGGVHGMAGLRAAELALRRL